MKSKPLEEVKFLTSCVECQVDVGDCFQQFPSGTVFLPLAEINLYYKVLTPQGTTGWIRKRYLEVHR